jgi:hypothetical protein
VTAARISAASVRVIQSDPLPPIRSVGGGSGRARRLGGVARRFARRRFAPRRRTAPIAGVRRRRALVGSVLRPSAVLLRPPRALEMDSGRREELAHRAAAVGAGPRAVSVNAVQHLHVVATGGTRVIVGRHGSRWFSWETALAIRTLGDQGSPGQPRSRRIPHFGQ